MDNLEYYKEIAKDARKTVLKMIFRAQTSHIGSNFSVIDILTVLYEKANIKKDDWENRDRIILSKGWAAASLYYFLWHKNLITEAELNSYCQPNSKFIGLAEPVCDGVEFAGGSMGHGFPAAVGMALAAKKAKKDWKVYCIMSDGEMDCGTTWECALIAAHHKLDNLIVIVDCNGWQAMGKTDDVLSMNYLPNKFKAFNWNTKSVDGHDFNMIEKALTEDSKMRPYIIFASTIKGKGVSIFEDKLIWHYKNINKAEYEAALKELV